jgi:hypothetical protein
VGVCLSVCVVPALPPCLRSCLRHIPSLCAESLPLHVSRLQGVENIYTQHTPLLMSTLDQLLKVGAPSELAIAWLPFLLVCLSFLGLTCSCVRPNTHLSALALLTLPGPSPREELSDHGSQQPPVCYPAVFVCVFACVCVGVLDLVIVIFFLQSTGPAHALQPPRGLHLHRGRLYV